MSNDPSAIDAPTPVFFWTGAGVVALILLLSFASLARTHGFAFDDFFWLERVQRGSFSLARTFFPIEARSWWGYRPLSNEAYFLFGLRSFGFDPVAFNAVSLFFHFATGAGLAVLARQLGCGAPASTIAGLLFVSRGPAVNSVLWSSSFIYVGCLAFSIATLVAFVAYLRAPGIARGALAAGSYLLALLCHEVALALPPVFGLLALFEERGALRERSTRRPALWRSVRGVLPLFGLWLGFVVWRFAIIAPSPMTGGYAPGDGPGMLASGWLHLSHLFAGRGQVALPLSILAAAGVAATASERSREIAQGWWLPLVLVALGWSLVVMVPFLPVQMTGARYALPVSLPFSLLLGASLQMIVSALGPGRSRAGEAVLCIALLAGVPYDIFAARAGRPQGALAGAALAQLEHDEHAFRIGTRVVVFYGGPGLAASSRDFSSEAVGGSLMLKSRFPMRALRMGFQGVEEPILAKNLGPEAVFYALGDDGSFLPADADLQRLVFFRALGSSDSEVVAVAAHQLALLLGPPARPRIVAAAERFPKPQARPILDALHLIPSAKSRGRDEARSTRRAWRRTAPPR